MTTKTLNNDNICKITGLIDIIDELKVENKSNYFTDLDTIELYQTCTNLMEEFVTDNPTLISEEDFHEIFDDNIRDIMQTHFDLDPFYDEDAEDDMDTIIDYAKVDFFSHYIPPRSYSETIILSEPNYNFIDKQINILRNKPQPVQRTKEWYEFRHNLITASNAYKAFENNTVKNQLIYGLFNMFRK